MAWPSPRTWELASDLYKINLPIKSAVGESVALEFESYLEVYGKIPDLKLIIEGKAKSIKFPESLISKLPRGNRYALAGSVSEDNIEKLAKLGVTFCDLSSSLESDKEIGYKDHQKIKKFICKVNELKN